MDNNSPTIQQAKNVQTDQQPYAQTDIIIYTVPGMKVATTWNSPRGILEWGADGRIRLYEVNKDSRQVVNTVFDVAPQEIVSIRPLEPTGFTIWLANGEYTFTFSKAGDFALAAGGVVGLLVAGAVYNRTGAAWWVNSLAQVGVQKKTSLTKIGGIIGIVVTIFLFVVIPLLIVLFHAIFS